MTNNINKSWTPSEFRKLKNLKNPHGIQKFLDSLPYHLAGSAWSPRKVLNEETAHCLEGSIFAAAALRVLGYKPLILDMEAHKDTDHVIAVYQELGYWGAIAKSNYTSCRGREPVYKSLRELVMSYFHTYFNMRKERTLRTFSRPVNLQRFDKLDWMTTSDPVWFIADYLCDIPHTKILKPKQIRNLARVDDRTYHAECLGKVKK